MNVQHPLLFSSEIQNLIIFTFLFSIAIGRVYPAFCTYKAIKNKEKDAFTQWLMYWVCFAIYSTGEYVTDIFLGFWFPFYNEIKIALLISFLFGKASGAEWVYTHVLCPHLDENEAVRLFCSTFSLLKSFSLIFFSSLLFFCLQVIENYIEKAKYYSIATFQYVCKEVITRFQLLTRSLLAQVRQYDIQHGNKQSE